MDILSMLKDITTFIQKSNDIEMTQKVIDIQQAILDIQIDQSRLTRENEQLRSIKELEEKVIRYKGKTYITLKEDLDNIFYCSRCWDRERKLVQLYESEVGTLYSCPDKDCKNSGYANRTIIYDETEEISTI